MLKAESCIAPQRQCVSILKKTLLSSQNHHRYALTHREEIQNIKYKFKKNIFFCLFLWCRHKECLRPPGDHLVDLIGLHLTLRSTCIARTLGRPTCNVRKTKTNAYLYLVRRGFRAALVLFSCQRRVMIQNIPAEVAPLVNPWTFVSCGISPGRPAGHLKSGPILKQGIRICTKSLLPRVFSFKPKGGEMCEPSDMPHD